MGFVPFTSCLARLTGEFIMDLNQLNYRCTEISWLLSVLKSTEPFEKDLIERITTQLNSNIMELKLIIGE